MFFGRGGFPFADFGKFEFLRKVFVGNQDSDLYY
jgi:hypothetical protein